VQLGRVIADLFFCLKHEMDKRRRKSWEVNPIPHTRDILWPEVQDEVMFLNPVIARYRDSKVAR